MQRQGYQTGLASAQWMMGDSLNTARGFDQVDVQSMAEAHEINEKGLSILDSFDLDQPWYLHLHYLDPHDPYSPPPEYRDQLNALEPLEDYDLDTTRDWYKLIEDFEELSEDEKELVRDHLEARYAGEVSYLDDQLAVMFDELDARGALDDTLVVLWSDHGEQLYQHGEPTHGGSMYDEEIRAVAGFWAQDIRPVAWSGFTSHTDIWPTIFTALGLGDDGVTSLPVGDDSTNEARAVFTHKDRGELSLNSITLQDHKLIYDWSGGIQFFDLSMDPEERHPIYDRGDARVQSLWSLLSPKVDAMSAASESGVTPTDPGVDP